MILGRTALPRPDGYVQTAWRARCDCGDEIVIRHRAIQRGPRQCQPCAARLPKHRKLTAEAVLHMRKLREQQRVPMAQLAARFGVSKSQVHGIVHGRWWKAAA